MLVKKKRHFQVYFGKKIHTILLVYFIKYIFLYLYKRGLMIIEEALLSFDIVQKKKVVSCHTNKHIFFFRSSF